MAKAGRAATVAAAARKPASIQGEFHIMLDIAFAKPALPKSGALVLLMGEGEKPSGLWQQADEATGGAIARALEAAEFKGGKGKTCTILAPGAGPVPRASPSVSASPPSSTPRVLNEAGGATAAAHCRARPPPPSPPARCSRRRRPRWRSARCCARIASTDTAPRKSPRTSRNSPSSPCSPASRRARKSAWEPLRGRGEGRVPDARPGQRAAQRAEPRRDGRSLQETDRARPEGRGAGP